VRKKKKELTHEQRMWLSQAIHALLQPFRQSPEMLVGALKIVVREVLCEAFDLVKPEKVPDFISNLVNDALAAGQSAVP
jgi:hypothetical protein